MAQVDFSNAVLECIPQVNFYQFGNSGVPYWGMEAQGGTSYQPLRVRHGSDDPYSNDINDFDVVTKAHNITVVRMEDGFKVIRSGIFSASGNYFFLMGNNTTVSDNRGGKALWKVSNIQYNDGDDYSFEITVRVNNMLQVEISNSVS